MCLNILVTNLYQSSLILPTNIHHVKGKQFPGLPLSTILEPAALSGTVRWFWLLLKEEVSSLDKEFKKPLSEVTELLSGAGQLLASEGVWTCTVSVRGCPTSSAAGTLLTMSSQDCLSLDPEEETRLGAFPAVSREEKEHEDSLSLGEEDDARRATCFPQKKSGGRRGEALWINHHSLHFVFIKIPQNYLKKWPGIKKVKGQLYDIYYCMAATRDHSLELIWVILSLPNKIWKISISKILTQKLKPLQPFKGSLTAMFLECLW